MKRCETSKVLLEWILPVHLRFQWLLDYLRKNEVSSNSDAKIQSDRNSQQELSDTSSSRIPSMPTGLIAWKINMACCHCEALQRRQRLLGGNVANWKLFGPSLVRMHVLRFWCTMVHQLPTIANPWFSNPFATVIETYRSHPTPAFSAAVSAVVKVGTSTRLFCLAALLPASSQNCTVLLILLWMKEAFHILHSWSVAYQCLSHWSSFHPGLLHSMGFPPLSDGNNSRATYGRWSSNSRVHKREDKKIMICS